MATLSKMGPFIIFLSSIDPIIQISFYLLIRNLIGPQMQPKELLKTHILHNILKSRNSCNFFEKFLPEIELVLSESSNFPFRHTHMIIGILSIQGVTAKSAHLCWTAGIDVHSSLLHPVGISGLSIPGLK